MIESLEHGKETPESWGSFNSLSFPALRVLWLKEKNAFILIVKGLCVTSSLLQQRTACFQC